MENPSKIKPHYSITTTYVEYPGTECYYCYFIYHCILYAVHYCKYCSSIVMTYYIVCHRVSHEFIGSRNCVPMTFTAESPPARGQ